MPKEEKKNTKGKKNITTSSKSSTKSTKVQSKKPIVEKVETIVEEKPIVKEKIKKGNKGNLFDRITENTPFAITLCLAILLFIGLVISLCYDRIPKTKDGKQVLATLKGKTITADDLYLELKEEYGTDALINVIDKYIVSKEVKVTDEDKKYVQSVVDYYKDYAEYYKTDLASFLANYVGLKNISTEDEFFDYVLEDYKKTLAVQNYISDNAKEEDLKTYYKENYTDSLTAKHILIKVDEEAEDTDAADKEAYNKATSLIKKLKKADKDDLDELFESLAEENSDDTETYADGGLIKDFTKNDVVSEFWDASYALKNGEYTTEPVKSTYGYHIILKVSSTPVKEYKEIKDEVKKAYATNLLSTDTSLQITKWDELRKEYKLSIKDDDVNEAYKKTIKNANSTTTDNTEEESTEE